MAKLLICGNYMLTSLLLCFIISASLLIGAPACAHSDLQKLLFVFGDSYVDTGNLPKTGPYSGPGSLYPYGIIWPHYPTGRCGDGKFLTGFSRSVELRNFGGEGAVVMGGAAQLLGIPTPPPYRLLAGQSIAHGVNFANAGSGVTYTLRTTPLGAQVDNFELFLRTDPYSKVALANSLTLVGVDGDDYVTFNGNFSTEGLVYINRVVTGVGINLQRLYDMGLRDVMVTNLLPPRCDPYNTKQSNYTICDTAADTLAEIHNELLLGVVEKINARNPGARFIILNQYAAFSQLYEQAQAHIGFTDGLVPCCIGLGNSSCGDTDPTGKPLYTLCKHRGKAMWWDSQHPTMLAWNYIVNLYATKPGFLLLADAPTLLKWWRNNVAIQEPAASPLPQPDMSLAIGELQQAVNSILANVNYSESLGLLEGVDVAALLGQLPAGNVTVFLPDNQAYLNAHLKVMDWIFSHDLVNAVALYHVVDSFLDYNTLLSAHPSNLSTFSSHLQLAVSFQPQGIFISHGSEAAQIEASPAQTVLPNLYMVPGKIAVHGVNSLLFPPNIMYTN